MNTFSVKQKQASSVCVPRGKDVIHSVSNDFVFQALPWDHVDYARENDATERVHTVFITGSTSDGNSVTVWTKFEPYFLVKLSGNRDTKWSKTQIATFYNDCIINDPSRTARRKRQKRRGEDDEFESVPRTFMYSPLDIDEDGLTEEEIKDERRTSRVKATMESEICGYEELWLKDLGAGFTCQLDKLPQIIPMEFQFIKLTFKSYAAMKACSFALQSEDVKRELSTKRLEISIYEANLDPHIRLMHLTKCEPSGWISLTANKFKFVTGGDRRSSSQIEIEVPNWKDIHPLDLNTLAPFRECSFDLETYSNDDGKMSSAYVHENVVLQIATTFTDFGSSKDIRVLYNLHDCDPIDEPNTVLKTFDNEKDMLLAWAQLISNSCPDTVHAYNGWEFDFEYLIQRAKIRGCWDQFRRTLGRIKSIPSQRVEQSLSSKAYGDNFWVMLTMSGRIVFDPLVHLQREFKLKSYALKDTSEYFLAVKLPKQPFRATAESDIVNVTHPNHGLAANKVVHFSDVDLPEEETTPDGKRFYSWNGWTYEDLNTTLFTVTSVISKDEYTVRLPQPAKRSCQGGGGTVKAFETKHDVSFPVMNQAYRDNNSAVMHDVMRYCCQDTLLPQKILTKLCVLPNLIEMSKVTWVPLDYLITRGQQVKVFSQICKAAHEAGYAVPTIVRPKSTDTTEDGEALDEGYVGGAVLDPFIGFYDDPIAVPDFKSLYPSTMIDNNLCPTTLLKDKRFDNIPGVMYNRIQVGSKTHVFGMNNDGIVPGILAYLLNTRDRRKEMMANAKTDIERMIHNGAQLALKVSANSIYGFMGIPADKAMLPCMPIAESTTQRGRNGTFATRDFMQDTSNFTEIMKYDANKDGMPLDWLYLMKNVAKNKCFHLTGEKLLKAYGISVEANGYHEIKDSKGLQIWTDKQFIDITAFALAVTTVDGKDMQLLRVFASDAIFFDMKMYSCFIVYGDTDSVFSKFNVDHLPKSQPHRVAYCSVVAAYVASRVTHFLRSNNPFKPFDKQWMELQYEKTYRFWLLFSKKRYAGEMTEHDPFHFADDQKGVASKRRDFCNYVKEIYGKILKSLFDPSPDVDRDTRIKNAISVVRKAIEDLLNNRVPFEKLVISKLLKSQYKVLKHSQSKSSKLCDFNHDNVFVDDLIKIRYGGAMVEAVITKIRAVHAFSGGGDGGGKAGKPLSVTIKTGEFTGKSLEITFGDITERSASVITLEKIMDPKTTDKVLEPVKHPHVRLARRMFLRDPATAPKSGARVPYVFCESKTKVLQYLRAEDPSYAKAHKLVVDPEYYLKKQCENAWAQILDTACPGISATIFAEAYAEYEKKSLRQPDIASYMAGTHTQKKSIELSKTVAKAEAVVVKSGPAPAKSIASYFTPVKAVKSSPVQAQIKAAPIKAAPVKVKDKVKEEQVPAKVEAPAKVKDELPKGSRSSQLIQAPVQAGKYVIKL